MVGKFDRHSLMQIWVSVCLSLHLNTNAWYFSQQHNRIVVIHKCINMFWMHSLTVPEPRGWSHWDVPGNAHVGWGHRSGWGQGMSLLFLLFDGGVGVGGWFLHASGRTRSDWLYVLWSWKEKSNWHNLAETVKTVSLKAPFSGYVHKAGPLDLYGKE